jgi:hypothetical protein
MGTILDGAGHHVDANRIRTDRPTPNRANDGANDRAGSLLADLAGSARGNAGHRRLGRASER